LFAFANVAQFFDESKNSQQAQRQVGGGYLFARRLVIVDYS
jgi:hypothetical protein